MPQRLLSFIKRWLITAVAVALAAQIVPGIVYVTPMGLVLVINALLLYAVGHMLKDFRVETFGSAFWGSLIISIVSLLLNSLTKTSGSAFKIRRGTPPPPPRRPPGSGDDGPVIDV
jgi:uncharacterized membrane protein YvlD (DUF360 family)